MTNEQRTSNSKVRNELFSVKLQGYRDLSEAEKAGVSHSGHGPEYATYLRVTHRGNTLYLESDAMEPEDATLGRDLRWVSQAIEAAYNLGVADGQFSG